VDIPSTKNTTDFYLFFSGGKKSEVSNISMF